ncbi:MAG: VWA domain-containing protein [Acidobacteria bacterium]|nr:VWA domain-containing protein [Acidobacteriota bacterium]
MRRVFFWGAMVSLLSIATAILLNDHGPSVEAASSGPITQGTLQIIDRDGRPHTPCPLKHTDVKAQVSGSLARVTVTQQFTNPLNESIEAVYAFPLPSTAAVDDMTMVIGERRVRGSIKRREEARAIYEAARNSGRTAALLDQERPNIFTQSVANILPGAEIKIEISYVEVMKYEEGSYEFVFPMVVGPRYIPGAPTGKQAGGWAPDTDRVPDASRITPPVARERAGHDLSLQMEVEAGVPIDSIASGSHEVDLTRTGASSARVCLKNRATIPNKDFRLKIDVAGRKIGDAILSHHDDRGGFFSMILQPPDRVDIKDVRPKELVFVLDTSGSMYGFPIEKAKETMKLALDGLYPQDTFNLITFAGDTHVLFPAPVAATAENLRRAQEFLASRKGGGGTEMMKAIRAALDPSDSQEHVRIVCFMTDGYVGNDFEIISEIQRHPNARIFSFGIGGSVNRFLLDKMAEEGRGEVEYVALNDDGSAAARRFHERVRQPLLTDIQIDWGGLSVADVYPRRIPDLFSAKPVVVVGRYTAPGRGRVRLEGRIAGQFFSREIPVEFRENRPEHDVLATLWARSRVEDLMGQDYMGMQRGTAREEIRESIVRLGIDFRLMTQFTSFVAVEERIVTEGGKPRRIEVPVEMPEGVSYDGVFGSNKEHSGAIPMRGRSVMGSAAMTPGTVAELPAPKASPKREDSRDGGAGIGGGSGSNSGRGSGVGIRDANERPSDGKLHPSLAGIIERLEKKQKVEASFIRDGRAEVQIWLTEKTPEAVRALKALGLEVIVDEPNSKLVVGRLPVEKLRALSELKVVRYIAP